MNKIFLGLLLCGAGAAPALGQNNPFTDDPIVVTAARAPARVSTLPADVSVIDAEAVRERGAIALDEALADAPGLAVVRTGPLGQQASIFSGGANSQHTLVLYDGVRINDPSTPAAGFDAGQDLLGGLDRIEVVQGPMSALYGSDAIGGVINMIPRRGGEGPLNARLSIAGGSFETISGEAGLDGTLRAFRYAVSIEGYASEGYDVIPARMSTHTGDPDGASMTTATGVFDLMLSDALSLDLLVRRRWAQSEFDAFAFDFTTFQEIRTDDGDLEIARNDLDLARLGATWRWGEAATLLASAGLLETDRAQADDGVETDAFEGERRFVDLTFAVEREAFELVIGAARETEEIDAVQFGSPIVAEQDQVGVFAALTGRWGIADVTGAVRVDEYDGFGSETTWRVGVNVRPLAGVRIYGAYGVSFRAPSLYERFTFFGSPGLAPEEGETWEFGADAKYAVFGQDEGLALSLVYRSSDLTDMIDFGPAFTYVNIDEAELESAQARVRVRPLSWLQGEIAYVYTDARDAVSDAPLLRRPENAWRASLEGDWGALRGTLSWRRVGERADILYADDGVFIGTGVTPAYDVVRASLAFDVADGASVSIAADNLFDEAYEPANAFAGAPRSVMVRLRLSP